MTAQLDIQEDGKLESSSLFGTTLAEIMNNNGKKTPEINETEDQTMFLGGLEQYNERKVLYPILCDSHLATRSLVNLFSQMKN